MAGADGRGNTALGERLAREPYRFDIRQAVHLLERALPDATPVGEGSDPEREAVRLRSSLTSAFPPSDIEALEWEQGGGSPRLTVTFMGLAGAIGPLPEPLSNRVLERERVHDHAARDFLDIFNHRLISLFQRHWRLFHPALQPTDRRDTPQRQPLFALLGLATPPADGAVPGGSARETGVTPAALTPTLLGAAGLLNQRPVSAHALERVIAAHFGVKARVVPLQGGWLWLDPQQVMRLGRVGRLGQDAVVGQRIWDQAAGIRIELGPLPFPLLTALLPGGAANGQIHALLRLVLGCTLDVTLRLMLRPQDVPAGMLGDNRPRLGMTAWIGQQERLTPATIDLRLNLAGASDAAHEGSF